MWPRRYAVGDGRTWPNSRLDKNQLKSSTKAKNRFALADKRVVQGRGKDSKGCPRRFRITPIHNIQILLATAYTWLKRPCWIRFKRGQVKTRLPLACFLHGARSLKCSTIMNNWCFISETLSEYAHSEFILHGACRAPESQTKPNAAKLIIWLVACFTCFVVRFNHMGNAWLYDFAREI